MHCRDAPARCVGKRSSPRRRVRSQLGRKPEIRIAALARTFRKRPPRRDRLTFASDRGSQLDPDAGGTSRSARTAHSRPFPHGPPPRDRRRSRPETGSPSPVERKGGTASAIGMPPDHRTGRASVRALGIPSAQAVPGAKTPGLRSARAILGGDPAGRPLTPRPEPIDQRRAAGTKGCATRPMATRTRFADQRVVGGGRGTVVSGRRLRPRRLVGSIGSDRGRKHPVVESD